MGGSPLLTSPTSKPSTFTGRGLLPISPKKRFEPGEQQPASRRTTSANGNKAATDRGGTVLRNGIYEDINGDKVKVANTETGYVITNTRTGEVTVIGR